MRFMWYNIYYLVIKASVITCYINSNTPLYFEW